MSNPVLPPGTPQPETRNVSISLRVPVAWGNPASHIISMFFENHEVIVGLSDTPLAGHVVLLDKISQAVLDTVKRRLIAVGDVVADEPSRIIKATGITIKKGGNGQG